MTMKPELKDNQNQLKHNTNNNLYIPVHVVKSLIHKLRNFFEYKPKID